MLKRALPSGCPSGGKGIFRFSGLCLCHLLWQMQGVDVTSTRGGIALPPALLPLILHQRGRQLMLFHVTSDTLCQRDPRKAIVNNVGCRYCIVCNEVQDLRGHFGNAEHTCGHSSTAISLLA